MTYEIKYTNKFKKDTKQMQRRGYDMSLLKEIISKLSLGEPLPQRNKDHALTGNWSGKRECHIAPDWLLIYEIDNGTLVLCLLRTGTHSDLF